VSVSSQAVGLRSLTAVTRSIREQSPLFKFSRLCMQTTTSLQMGKFSGRLLARTTAAAFLSSTHPQLAFAALREESGAELSSFVCKSNTGFLWHLIGGSSAYQSDKPSRLEVYSGTICATKNFTRFYSPFSVHKILSQNLLYSIS
jgi:hypothetical protein